MHVMFKLMGARGYEDHKGDSFWCENTELTRSVNLLSLIKLIKSSTHVLWVRLSDATLVFSYTRTPLLRGLWFGGCCIKISISFIGVFDMKYLGIFFSSTVIIFLEIKKRQNLIIYKASTLIRMIFNCVGSGRNKLSLALLYQRKQLFEHIVKEPFRWLGYWLWVPNI